MGRDRPPIQGAGRPVCAYQLEPLKKAHVVAVLEEHRRRTAERDLIKNETSRVSAVSRVKTAPSPVILLMTGISKDARGKRPIDVRLHREAEKGRGP